MTRSFGDVLIKDLLAENFECTLESGFAAPLIVSEPEIQTHTIDSDDEFLLIACDGLYDVFSSQQAIDFVHEELSKGCRKEQVRKIVVFVLLLLCFIFFSKVADKLISRAIELGTLDNVSVQLVFFDHARRP